MARTVGGMHLRISPLHPPLETLLRRTRRRIVNGNADRLFRDPYTSGYDARNVRVSEQTDRQTDRWTDSRKDRQTSHTRIVGVRER